MSSYQRLRKRLEKSERRIAELEAQISALIKAEDKQLCEHIKAMWQLKMIEKTILHEKHKIEHHRTSPKISIPLMSKNRHDKIKKFIDNFDKKA
jgi:hypothetical protein